MMKQVSVYCITLVLLITTSCGQEKGVDAKKSQLKEYQNEVKDLQTKIAALEEEIAEEDPDFAAANSNATLITSLKATRKNFEHYIHVSGNVASDRNVTINAEASAKINRVYIEKGDMVKKGQLLILQDGETIQRNIEELETSLELANTRFERQSNLWKQEIGTEMQFLEARNNKESLERRLASAKTQLSNYRLVAPFSGTIDEVFVKEGEVAAPGVPMLRLVSLQEMYIVADVSEAYLGQFDKGDSVKVRFPSMNKTIMSAISSVGQVINQNNRTFEIQVKLPKDEVLLRPNLLAVLEIKDFQQENAIVIPTNLIQSDNRGDYVFVVNQADGQMIAKKKPVERGMTYQNQTMIQSGLEVGDMIVEEGSREVTDGAMVKLAGQTDNAEVVSSVK